MLELTVIGSRWERSIVARLGLFPNDPAATGLAVCDFSVSDGDSKKGDTAVENHAIE